MNKLSKLWLTIALFLELFDQTD